MMGLAATSPSRMNFDKNVIDINTSGNTEGTYPPTLNALTEGHNTFAASDQTQIATEKAKILYERSRKEQSKLLDRLRLKKNQSSQSKNDNSQLDNSRDRKKYISFNNQGSTYKQANDSILSQINSNPNAQDALPTYSEQLKNEPKIPHSILPQTIQNLRDQKNLNHSRSTQKQNNLKHANKTDISQDHLFQDVSQDDIVNTRPKTQQNSRGRQKNILGGQAMRKPVKLHSNQDEYSNQDGMNLFDQNSNMVPESVLFSTSNLSPSSKVKRQSLNEMRSQVMFDQLNRREVFSSNLYKKSDSRPSILSNNIEPKKIRIGQQNSRGVIKQSKSMQKFGATSHNLKEFDGILPSFDSSQHVSQSKSELMQQKILARQRQKKLEQSKVLV